MSALSAHPQCGDSGVAAKKRETAVPDSKTMFLKANPNSFDALVIRTRELRSQSSLPYYRSTPFNYRTQSALLNGRVRLGSFASKTRLRAIGHSGMWSGCPSVTFGLASMGYRQIQNQRLRSGCMGLAARYFSLSFLSKLFDKISLSCFCTPGIGRLYVLFGDSTGRHP